ncbi:stAR-related lipid transfer protein 3 isoform X8 [Balaenoptera acutorostrata]|uniref:StAR-related lipid transfer protein 3 isoform X8 n=1 Tax=Balaenoptera acutorostrata TaxID=9767 RepID=A0A383ZR82_BALAC|nr:stAR-related lipid transfer protein 3 isoform X8 [Balaenoptera acutorostrata]
MQQVQLMDVGGVPLPAVCHIPSSDCHLPELGPAFLQYPPAVLLRPGPLCLEVGAARMSKLSREPARDLERSLPAVASLGSSLSHSQSLSSRFLPPPREKRRAISDVRRTFCLFVTFDLLFISLLWIIELNTNTGIQKNLEQEIIQYSFKTSFFDIFVLAFFRFSGLLLGYAVLRLRHWSPRWCPVHSSLSRSSSLSCSAKGPSATCSLSSPSSSPGWRPGSLTSKSYPRRLRRSDGILLPRLLSPEDPCSSPAPCPRASSIHPQNPLQGLTMNQMKKLLGRKASLPRNGSTSSRGRRLWRWWTRSWPRRRTGSLRRIIFEGEARLWPCVWCFVSWSKQYYLKRWHRTWKTEGKHPHPLLWPVPLAALVGMEDTVLRGCSHSCGPAFKLDIKSLSLLIAEHLSEPLFWFFLLKCS